MSTDLTLPAVRHEVAMELIDAWLAGDDYLVQELAFEASQSTATLVEMVIALASAAGHLVERCRSGENVDQVLSELQHYVTPHIPMWASKEEADQ